MGKCNVFPIFPSTHLASTFPLRFCFFLLDLFNVMFTFISFDLMKIIKIFQTCVDQAKISNAELIQML